MMKFAFQAQTEKHQVQTPTDSECRNTGEVLNQSLFKSENGSTLGNQTNEDRYHFMEQANSLIGKQIGSTARDSHRNKAGLLSGKDKTI